MRCCLWLALLVGFACHAQTRHSSTDQPIATPIVILRMTQLEGADGKLVTLQGLVQNSRIATLLGVDVESESPDLRGRPAFATGVLHRQVVTQEQVDREIAARGQFAHRGPGTYYRLVDSTTGRLAQVQGAESTMFRAPPGRYQLEARSPTLILELLPEWRLRLTSQPTGQKVATVAEGAYAVTATKMGSFHLTWAVDRVDGSAPRMLDTDLDATRTLSVTLGFDCVDGRRAVQLCFHDAGADGRQVVCRTLMDPASTCTPGPAVDGSKINAPAR